MALLHPNTPRLGSGNSSKGQGQARSPNRLCRRGPPERIGMAWSIALGCNVSFRPIADIRLGGQTDLVKQLLGIAALALLAAACSSPQQTCSGPSRTVSRPGPPAVALVGRVTDVANVLSAEQRLALSRELEQFELRTKHQMVVVTVRSLGGEDVADFTRDLANSWGIGRKCYDDGIVLLVAPNERKVRIAVGYGLERTVTDEVSRRIIVQRILPEFRRGDLPRGIKAGTEAIIAAAS